MNLLYSHLPFGPAQKQNLVTFYQALGFVWFERKDIPSK
jgi:hypothetical protein